MSDGFKKIELDTFGDAASEKSQDPPKTQAFAPNQMSRRKKPNLLRKLSKLFLILFVAVTILSVVIAIPSRNIYSSAKASYQQVKLAYDAGKNQDISKFSEEIKKTEDELEKTKSNFKWIAWTKAIPFFGNYTRDAEHLINSGIYGCQAAEILAEAIKPYADVLGLKGQGTFTGGSAEERIVKVVQTLDKVTPQIDQVGEKLKLIRTEIDQIDPNRYPESFQGKKIKSNIILAKDLIDQSETAIVEAKPVLQALPNILGEPNAKRYLVLFQNDKEIRPTGGFITAYAFFKVDKGKVIAERSDDIYKLDDLIKERTKAPEPILKYLPNVPYWYLRDSNISPDFKTSMLTFESFFKKTGLKEEFDGIIAVDTQLLVRLMKTLEDFGGPIKAYGTEFSTKNDPRCNCPQVVYELELYADKPVAYERGSRKDILGVLMQEIMKRALGSAKQAWGPLFQTGLNAITEKHVIFYFHDNNAQKGAESFKIAGEIQDFDGDYLHVNNTNFGGAKSNMYVQESVDQNVEVSSDGTVTKTVTLSYKNPFQGSDCNLERGNLCLNGELRDWLRLYVPKGSKLIDSTGSEVKVAESEDLGKSVFESFFRLRPLGSTKLTFKYTLPFKVQKGTEYPLLIQKQPGTEGNDYTLSINGHKEQFKLTTDKEIRVKI